MIRLYGWLALLALAAVQLQASPIVREPEAIYLSDFSAQPIQVKLKAATMSYFRPDMQRYAGTLRFPQTVEVQAITDHACRVRGNAQQGQVLAWVPTEALEGLPPELLADLRKAEERRKVVEALIAKNEVAIGMTVEEVARSIGRPQKTTSRVNEEGEEQIWEYIRYKLVPQQTLVNTPTGPATSVLYVRVPVGTMEVRYRDGLVVALDQTEGTLVGAGSTIVVPPLNLSW